MKLLFACGLILCAPVWAGKRIQMETTDLTNNTVRQDEMLVDTNRFRVNSGPGSVIFLTDGGRSRMLMLDKQRNEYREIDEQMMNELGQQMQGMMAQIEAQMKNLPPEQRAMMEQMMKGKMPPQMAQAARPVFTAKGAGTVNGFRCTNYEGAVGGQKIAEICSAQPADLKLTPADFQVFDKMREFTAGLQRAVQNMPITAALSSIGDSQVDGFPVQQTSFNNGRAASKSELKSVTEASFTDADFSLGNAKKVDMALPRAR
jgi:hypothetical protein